MSTGTNLNRILLSLEGSKMNIPMCLFRKKVHKNVTQFAVEIRECFEVFLRGRPHRERKARSDNLTTTAFIVTNVAT